MNIKSVSNVRSKFLFYIFADRHTCNYDLSLLYKTMQQRENDPIKDNQIKIKSLDRYLV